MAESNTELLGREALRSQWYDIFKVGRSYLTVIRTPPHLFLCDAGIAFSWSDVPRHKSRKGNTWLESAKMAVHCARRI